MIKLYPNRRWLTVSVFVFALAVCFTGLTATAAAQEISVDNPVEIPETDEGGFTVNEAAVHESGENITVNLNNYDKSGRVQLTGFQISKDYDEIDNPPSEATLTWGAEPQGGSYWVHLYDDGESRQKVYPVIVPMYEIGINNPPTSLDTDENINFEITLTEKSDVGRPSNGVEVVLWNSAQEAELSVEHSTSSGSTHTYTVSGNPSNLNLDTTEYRMSVSAVGDEQNIAFGTYKKESLALKNADEKLTITEAENNNDDGSDNDDDDGGGGQGGGQGGVGAGGGSEEETNTGPATVQDVRDTVQLVEPDTQSETEIETASSGQGGPTVEPDEGSSVQRIQFEDESASGSVSITEYGAPPSTVEDEVIESVTNDISNSESSSGDSTTGDDGTNMRVVSLTDISPTTESAEESPATVELTVDSSAIDDPDQLTVVKEGYSFEAQTDKWQQLETSVSDTGDGTITLEAKVDSFSLFAVTETMPSQSSNTGTIEPNSTDQAGSSDSTDSGDSDNENTADPTPGFGFITVLVTLLIAAVGSRRIS